MGNLDFTNNAGFSAYCVALLVAGVVMIAVSALSSVWRAKASAVVIGVLIGVASLGYGLYLIFAFKGGTYFISELMTWRCGADGPSSPPLPPGRARRVSVAAVRPACRRLG